MLAANAPDIDILAYTRGEYFALAFRRGITHGWPALIVLPFLVTAVMLAWDRFVRRRRDPAAPAARPAPLLALSALGVATHPVLDWMNTYGMRWGLPFDPAWTYGDSLFIIDPWIWLVVGGSVFIASRPNLGGMLGWGSLALVTSLPILLFPLSTGTKALWLAGLGAVVSIRLVVGAPEPTTPGAPGPRSRLGVAGVALLGLYIGGMVGSDVVARGHVAEVARAAGLDVRDLMVAPLPGDPLGAELEVLTGEGYVPGDFRWTRDPRVRLFPEDMVSLREAPAGMPAATADAVVAFARADSAAALYHVWARFPYAVVESSADGWTVTFSDARYDGRAGAGGLSGLMVTVRPEDIR